MPSSSHMVEYYVQRVREVSQQRTKARAAIGSRAALSRLQQDIRRKLSRCFSPFPHRSDLNPRCTGTLERRHYRIEKITYESRPGFIVTANLYLPHTPGRHPAVLQPCGHGQSGKAHSTYQLSAQNLARQGYVVLVYDPVSQGERWQRLEGHDPGPEECCIEHTLMGNQMLLVGDFLGTWRTWDGKRSLDYLLSRPEVDPTRVAVVGCSGGGLMTSYIWALDDRPAVAAPVCYVTRLLCNTENELAADAEQIPPGLLREGLDIADLFIARIPKPVILLGQNNDFFDRRGLEETYRELLGLYRLAGAEENLQLFVGHGSHGFPQEIRERMYSFLNRQLGVRANPREPAGCTPEDAKTLFATDTGELRSDKSRRLVDLTAGRAQELAKSLKRPSEPQLIQAIQRALVLPDRETAPHHRVLRPRHLSDGRFQSTFAIESENGILALLHHFGDQPFEHLPPGRDATLYVPHLSAARDVLAGQAPKSPLFALDVRGLGDESANSSEFSKVHGTDYFLASQASLLGEPLVGRRVHDLLCALDLLSAVDYRVHLVGRGLGAVLATFAACLHPAVKRVTLINALRSFHELTQSPAPRWPLSSLVPGVLTSFDLPDCYRVLKKRKRLSIREPWDAQMRPIAKPVKLPPQPAQPAARRSAASSTA